MSTTAQKVFVVTGANRGIGLELVKCIAKNPSNIVYAGTRNPAQAVELNTLGKQNGSIRVVKWDVSSKQDHQSAAELIKNEVGKVDTIIANAGIMSELVPLAQLSDKVLMEAIQVNAVGGNLYLYQAFQSLLSASDDPKFVSVSTLSAMLSGQFGIPQASYSISKVAVNMILQRIHVEDPAITAFPIHPGLVMTDMAATAMEYVVAAGIDPSAFPPPIESSESAESILKVAQAATRETHSGKFWSYDGTVLAW